MDLEGSYRVPISDTSLNLPQELNRATKTSTKMVLF